MKTYLLATDKLTPQQIDEIEGYLAQLGVHVEVINPGKYEYVTNMVDVAWHQLESDMVLRFRLARPSNAPIEATVLELLESRLVMLFSRVTRIAETFTMIYPGNYILRHHQRRIEDRIRNTINTTLDYLGPQ